MILTDLFVDIADFRSFAPYVESNVTFEELNSSALSAKKQIIIILSKAVYEEVCKMPFPCNRLLNLFYFQKKRGEEIAQIMNYSGPDSVKTQKSKCMRKIEAILRKRLGR